MHKVPVRLTDRDRLFIEIGRVVKRTNRGKHTVKQCKKLVGRLIGVYFAEGESLNGLR